MKMVIGRHSLISQHFSQSKSLTLLSCNQKNCRVQTSIKQWHMVPATVTTCMHSWEPCIPYMRLFSSKILPGLKVCLIITCTYIIFVLNIFIFQKQVIHANRFPWKHLNLLLLNLNYFQMFHSTPICMISSLR